MSPTTKLPEFTPVRHIESRYPGQGVTVGLPFQVGRRVVVNVQWPGQTMTRPENLTDLTVVTR